MSPPAPRRLPVLLVAALVLVAGGAVAQSGPVVKFAGAVGQDGCPFCCEFSCQQTPTPTPEVDAQGRPVFRRSAGQFLFVVEGAPGTANRQPGSEGIFSGGTVLPIVDPSGKPSLMAMADHDLGDGSPQVDCRTEPLGGVRGFPALDFNAGGDATTALAEMACHFELATSAMFACTRDRFGVFAFLNAQSSRQYCFQVSTVTAFPIGRTTVAVQLRDVSGNRRTALRARGGGRPERHHRDADPHLDRHADAAPGQRRRRDPLPGRRPLGAQRDRPRHRCGDPDATTQSTGAYQPNGLPARRHHHGRAAQAGGFPARPPPSPRSTPPRCCR
ncbi:MAG: hypothetical protein U0802_24930 [Candidatus Binatia bacterium]